ncbi:MAG: caspase family protein, partial [Planctomycetes bacterium]|nr:caspase family protein [Planctomycetota bacterium]
TAASIRKLTGARATHEAIVRTFHDHLIARAGPDTQVVFWFSGHGSRVPDPSARDTSARDDDDRPKDDTLLAYDSRAGDRDGSYDITDDELHSLLAALRSRQVLVVTDCCHSGGVLRGADTGAVRAMGDGRRPLERAALQAFWPTDVPFRDDEAGTLVTGCVHLAACGSDQEAGEVVCFGRSFGTLTWFLTDALAEAEANCSWRTIGEIVRARVAGVGTHRSQLVQWSGDAIDRAILGGRGASIPPGFALQASAVPLRVDAGRIHGLGDGARLRAFGLDDAIHGTLQVVRAHQTWSEVRWIERTRPAADPEPLRVRPQDPGSGRAPLRIRLDDGVDADLLRDCAWAEVATQAAEYVLAREGDGLRLCEPDGTYVRSVPTTARAAHDVLFQEHCFRSLWEGIAQPGSCQLEVRAAAPAAATAAQFALPAARVTSATGQPRATVVAPTLGTDPTTGAVLELAVTNRGDRGVHVAILSVAEDRKVTLIWGEDRNNYLDAGATTKQLIQVGPSPAWRRERAMIDRYVVVATSRWADFRAFTATTPPPPTRGHEERGLPPLLARAVGCGADTMRGGDAGGWGVTWFDLVLEPVTRGAGRR